MAAVRDFTLLVVSAITCGSPSITPSSLVTVRVIEHEKMGNGVSTVNEVYSGPQSRMLQPRFQRFEYAQS